MSLSNVINNEVNASMGQTISPESYTFLQQWIQRESGIVVDQDKTYLLQSRLNPILESEKLASIEVLCGKLRGNMPGLGRKVIEAMTTNETLFFRDAAPFEALRNHIVPKLMSGKAKGQKLLFWSAAASTGQEAYSLAMLLLDMGLTSYDAEILGSDLSEEVLERARTGVYGKFEINRGLPQEYLNRYFEPHGNDWRIREEVRKMVRFKQRDLRDNLSNQGLFHVILCRNVLIYFNAQVKKDILSEMSRALVRGGYLILGAAETVSSDIAALERQVYGQGVAYVAT